MTERWVEPFPRTRRRPLRRGHYIANGRLVLPRHEPSTVERRGPRLRNPAGGAEPVVPPGGVAVRRRGRGKLQVLTARGYHHGKRPAPARGVAVAPWRSVPRRLPDGARQLREHAGDGQRRALR